MLIVVRATPIFQRLPNILGSSFAICRCCCCPCCLAPIYQHSRTWQHAYKVGRTIIQFQLVHGVVVVVVVYFAIIIIIILTPNERDKDSLGPKETWCQVCMCNQFCVLDTVCLGSRCRSVFKTQEFRFDYLTNMIDGIENMSFVCWHFLESRILAEILSFKNTV